ncbi:MAG: glutamine-hydrolyzing carbamoyl-phosphate synthase small subunit [Clostridiales bacterium]|jgi:carbamoyl-phosphate synthase small subunit|nr:glutamine-hydrolyzing carbamoyl-phosphate synthase small subunit [Clostridiales bacterium]
MERNPKKLMFENREVFYGKGFGADIERVCEVVFNTSMVGYQEIFSDCSYNEQFVCMTYPLIGNYGMAAEDYETLIPRIGGFIVREYNESLANFRATKTLAKEMEEQGIPGIDGVDTRKITRMIRDQGSMRAALCDADKSDAEALRFLESVPVPREQVKNVSCKKRWYMRAANAQRNVVAVDCGVKLHILNGLTERGCNVTVTPYDTTAEDVLALSPDGLFLSNGPGDPRDAQPLVRLVKELKGKIPIFGICLGHQIIALAHDAETYKLKFGHRGGNHPVKHLRTGKIEITSQNHSYAVDADSAEAAGLNITHVNLLDGTVEGLSDESGLIFSAQYHPESCPGPQDSAYLFDIFIKNMEAFREGSGSGAKAYGH